MKKKHINIIAYLMVIVGLLFLAQSILSVQFNPDPGVWFKANYYIQFIPLYISVTLLLCGVFVLTGFSRANVYLAVFGHATSEEIIFSLIGLTISPLQSYSMAILLPMSLIALVVAYMNTLKRKPVSFTEAIFGIAFSTAFIVLPRYL